MGSNAKKFRTLGIIALFLFLTFPYLIALFATISGSQTSIDPIQSGLTGIVFLIVAAWADIRSDLAEIKNK